MMHSICKICKKNMKKNMPFMPFMQIIAPICKICTGQGGLADVVGDLNSNLCQRLRLSWVSTIGTVTVP